MLVQFVEFSKYSKSIYLHIYKIQSLRLPKSEVK